MIEVRTCSRHPEVEAAPGRTLCPRCLEYAKLQHWREAAAHGMTIAEFRKHQRAEARARGMCSRCLTRRAEKGRKGCRSCIDKGNKRFMDRAQAKRAIGLCWCGRNRQSGRQVCASCFESATRSHAKIRKLRRLAGLCQSCDRPANGKVNCHVHAKRQRLQSYFRLVVKRYRKILETLQDEGVAMCDLDALSLAIADKVIRLRTKR